MRGVSISLDDASSVPQKMSFCSGPQRGLWVAQREVNWLGCGEQQSSGSAEEPRCCSPQPSCPWAHPGGTEVPSTAPRLHGIGSLGCPWFYMVTGTPTFNLVTESPLL